jgi:hypothetical protein
VQEAKEDNKLERSYSTDTVPDNTEPPSSLVTLHATNGGNTSTEEVEECFPELVPGDLVRFPCLVGMNGQAAKTTLKQTYPEQLDIVVLPEGSPVSRDLRFNRVRIFVNDQNVVSIVPRIG